MCMWEVYVHLNPKKPGISPNQAGPSSSGKEPEQVSNGFLVVHNECKKINWKLGACRVLVGHGRFDGKQTGHDMETGGL